MCKLRPGKERCYPLTVSVYFQNCSLDFVFDNAKEERSFTGHAEHSCVSDW